MPCPMITFTSGMVLFKAKVHRVRAGGCEMHCMAAMQGGIIAQEIIKLLTHQYVPLDNTFIFNGIKSTSSSLRL